MKKYPCIVYDQMLKDKKQKFISTVLPFKCINDHSEVLVYDGKNQYGYQRPLNNRRIDEAIKDMKDDIQLVSPTSILLGVDYDVISQIIEIEINNQYSIDTYSLDVDKFKGKIFRIIDGQHRIKMLEKMGQKDKTLEEEINNYMLNVIIVPLQSNERSKEVDLFCNINSKAKRIKMDLAILSRFNYQLLENNVNFKLDEHLATAIVIKLNESSIIWKNSFYFDNYSDVKGIISYKAFIESIMPIARKVIKDSQIKKDSDTIHKIDELAKEIATKVINKCWFMVQEKWPSCFSQDALIQGDSIYKESSFIQKTPGVNAINRIICKLFSEYEFDCPNYFKTILIKSNVIDNDWFNGGRLSGLNSGAGFNIIRKAILNEK